MGARPAQPAINGNALALKPAVAPELVRHVTNFKTTVTEQLSKRTTAAEAVAMSVINRGLGLAAESTIPEEEGLEKIVLGVFESSRKNLGANQSLHPGLVQTLGNFKNNMIRTLEPKMGKLNAERLILSAVDRVLGFADRSTMPGPESDKKQYDEAENVLISAIQRVVTEHQRTLAAVASVSTPQAAPRPGPPPSAPAAASNTALTGHMPASDYTVSARPIAGAEASPADPLGNPRSEAAAPAACALTTRPSATADPTSHSRANTAGPGAQPEPHATQCHPAGSGSGSGNSHGWEIDDDEDEEKS
ncbi:hypothetical protein NEMBOFW57_004960 [Staphylotrichum longicolle]|uniref:Uncharacterized protein n=1 Tax=Staphylotrichum longicolle TaxID=669026 RepID=A0AAD4EWG0_9PEZI|nr:hypothetical protein NEMBOFW57_004960 [Staphylotrichum longicolle]